MTTELDVRAESDAESGAGAGAEEVARAEGVRGSARPRVLHVGYHPGEAGGVTEVTETLRPLLPNVAYHPATRRAGGRWRALGFSAAALASFPGALLVRRPDVVQVVVASPADQLRVLPFVALARLAGARVVLAFHYNIGPAFRVLPRAARLAVGAAYRRAHRLCFLTEGLRADFVAAVGPCPAAVIPNPLAPLFAGVEPLPREARDGGVVFLGRFQREKGIFELLEAALGGGLGGGVHFWGDGARPRDVPAGCSFHGWVSGAAKVEVVRRARVLVLPSHAEAFPLVLLEAMACGTPVVATRVGGVPDVVQDGVQGRLVAVGDAAGLRLAVNELLGDDDFWRACSGRARETAARYRPAEVAARWRAVYAGG